MSRAKVVKCEHGFIHSAHIYKVGDPKDEAEAIRFVSKVMKPTDTFEDVDVDEARPLLWSCTADCRANLETGEAMSAPTLTRLDEVVRYWDAMPHAEPLTLVGDQYADFLALIAVARDIVGGAEERSWCETHADFLMPHLEELGRCRWAQKVDPNRACRMVSVLVWRTPDSEQVSPTTH